MRVAALVLMIGLLAGFKQVDDYAGTDAEKFAAAMADAADGEIILLEPRNYTPGVVVAPMGKSFLWVGEGATVNGTVQPTLPGFFLAVMPPNEAGVGARIRLTNRDPNGRNIYSVFNPVRNVLGGQASNPLGRNVSTIRSDVHIAAEVKDFSREWAVTGFARNYGDIEVVGVSGVTVKYGNGTQFGGHFQVVDESDATRGSSLGMESSIVGLPGTTGHRSRYVVDILAKTKQVGAWQTNPAQIDAGVRIRNSTGVFKAGLVFEDAAHPLKTAIKLEPGMLIDFGAAQLTYDAQKRCFIAIKDGRSRCMHWRF